MKDTEKSCQIYKERGCTLIKGSIPTDDFVRFSRQVSPDDTLSPGLSLLTGSSVAWGTKADCRALEREYAGRHADALEKTHHEAIPTGAIAWVRYGEMGASAIALFWQLAGCPPFSVPEEYRRACPRDTYDLRRCRLLLEQVPGWMEHLPEMSEVSPEWESLVREWPTVCAVMDRENPEWRKHITQNRSLDDVFSMKTADHEAPLC